MGRQDFLSVETTATGAELDDLTQSNVSGNTHSHAPTWNPVPPTTGGYSYGVGGETPQWAETADNFIVFRGMIYKGTATAGVITNIGDWPAAAVDVRRPTASSVNGFPLNGITYSPKAFPTFLNSDVAFGTPGQFVLDYVDLAGYYHQINPVKPRRDTVAESTGRQRFLEVATAGTPSQLSELVSANPDATTPHRHITGSIPLTPLSGWVPTVNATPTLHGPLQDGRLYLSGIINSLSGAPTSDRLFQLPAGSSFLPAYETRIPVKIFNELFISSTGVIRIQLNGEIWFEPFGTGPEFPLVPAVINFGIRWWPA